MTDTRAFSQPVHRSLLQRELMGGVPQLGLILLFLLAVIFIYGLRLYPAIVPIVLLYFVMRHLTKLDQWLIDIVLENIQQKDLYLP